MTELFIDTGGTFTDCILRKEDGSEFRMKVMSHGAIRGKIIAKVNDRTLLISEDWKIAGNVLHGFRFRILGSDSKTRVDSYEAISGRLTLSGPFGDLPFLNATFELFTGEEAPLLAARLLTNTPSGSPLPPIHMKLGSTKGTNALLEKKGSPPLLIVTKGFKDLLEIGTQQRPDIFAMEVRKPDPLPGLVIEVDERVGSDGEIIKSLDGPSVRESLEKARQQGFQSAAVCLMNSPHNPSNETAMDIFLKSAGFKHISVSTRLSALIKYLPRTQTTTVNAYLSPVITGYVDHLLSGIGEGRLQIMTSAGGLVEAEDFHPKDSLLSGPAGGVVGAVAIGSRTGCTELITFDMGGTSTDVSRYEGRPDYRFEMEIGGATVFSPAISIETVAAGGGSICGFDGYRLFVGPESAGASPGPACYGAGGPLCITDVNLLAGRLDVQRFGIPVSHAAADEKLSEIIQSIRDSKGEERTREDLLNGFLQIANEIMAGAIRKISIAKGYNPSDYSLVAFGGAGGMHACSVADMLGVRNIIVPGDAGLLSAFGIACAPVERMAERQILKPAAGLEDELTIIFERLSEEALSQVRGEREGREALVSYKALFLRMAGQDSALETHWTGDLEKSLSDFREMYLQVFGYYPADRPVEVESARVMASTGHQPLKTREPSGEDHVPDPSHFIMSLIGNEWKRIPVYLKDRLAEGAIIAGPSLILDHFCTTTVDDGWNLRIDPYGSAIMTKVLARNHTVANIMSGHLSPETELELFTNRFMGIAEDMGAMLQRTALSVNVKERLDFSCALLNAEGQLVANAPHIPVHLGGLGTCVREVAKTVQMNPGDMVVTNHPSFGGSHLPDVTVICPVHDENNALAGYVANRAHHAEIGGISPASMPATALNLSEEGVLIPPFYLVKEGVPDWEGISQILLSGPFPTRAIDENLADLNAAIAANRKGSEELVKLIRQHGLAKVMEQMDRLYDHASMKTRRMLQKIPAGKYHAEEFLDDGTPLRVSLGISEAGCTIDFSGSGDVHPGNMNATRAIVKSVVIYVLRMLISEPIPLNDGMLDPVKLILPKGLLNPIFPSDPAKCPSIVGGNVEVSQRLTDTILKSLGMMACSQGTMNNLLFGNDIFSYYETIRGGCGAGKGYHGASAVHHHMTNTRITDPEILEHRYPVRLLRFEIRQGSGGSGKWNGGNGVIRELLFLDPVTLSILTQHRKMAPYGMNGGMPGKTGWQKIFRADNSEETLDGIDAATLFPGDRLVIATPGGGGYGIEYSGSYSIL